MRLLAALLALALPACLGGGTGVPGTDAGGAGMAAAAGGGPGGGGQSGPGAELLRILYPEDLEIEVERTVRLRTSTGALEVLKERFRADGEGNYRLDLLEYSPSENLPPGAVPPQVGLIFEGRQRFLVRFRDLHVGKPGPFLENYDVTKLPDAQVAGYDCDRYQVVSKAGLGTVELSVLKSTLRPLLLAWSFRAMDGSLLAQLDSGLVNFQPNLQGVIWAGEQVKEIPYTGDNTRLGFEPLTVHYLPPGFEPVQKEILVMPPGLAQNLFLEVYSDGLLHLFVLQQLRISQSTQGPPISSGGRQFRGYEARVSRIGAYEILEGDVYDLTGIVVGPLDRDEILTVFGSLDP